MALGAFVWFGKRGSPTRRPLLPRNAGTAEPVRVSEAIRKPLRTVAARSCSILAVMKRRAIAGTEPVEHKVYVTDLDHSSTGFYTALIVLAVPAIPTVP